MSNKNNNETVKELKVSEIFNDDTQYIVPIYQRNYAWENDEIEQLIKDIEDVKDKNYYLGTLIVNEQKNNLFEVIDGQQRLTTLYLIKKYFNKDFDKNADKLQFEAREKYKRTFQDLENIENNQNNYYAQEIIKGMSCISNYFDIKEEKDKEDFKKQLANVYIVRVQVPKNIDLNHYFEIMNTRGEQLEPHEIAKAKILETLSDPEDKNIASQIWESCSDMNSYIQMKFDNKTKYEKNQTLRDKLFGEDWNTFNYEKFNDLKEKVFSETKNKNENQITDEEELLKKIIENKTNDNELCKCFEDNCFSYSCIEEILNKTQIKEDIRKKIKLKNNESLENIIKYANHIAKYPQDINNEKKKNQKSDDEEKERFESIIKFPNFLLHVNAIINGTYKNDNEGAFLDDKKFLDLMKTNYEEEKKAKIFIFNLLKYRFLFDKYVLKRDYGKNKNEGEWSLKQMKVIRKNEEHSQDTFSYVNTFSDEKQDNDEINDQDNDEINDQNTLKLLQATLRITYTSPKTMKWITQLLEYVGGNKEPECSDLKIEIKCSDLVSELEKFCCDNIELKADEDFYHKDGNRIIFSYLDYLLYKDGYDGLSLQDRKNWKCVYRNSIEHFSPQTGGDFSERPEILHSFGNLALITVSGNSKFSNMTPHQKIDKQNLNIINQSLKLKIMQNLLEKNNEKWTEDIIKLHGDAMIKLLQDKITNANSECNIGTKF